ncbi:MAG: hypothetical protein H0U73_05165 [Tatlockia sp.]|nr:hypothetical protein [Tatlockia sp.]
MNETLKFQSAINHPNLVGPTVTFLLQNWHGIIPVEDIHVAEIDPLSAGGQDFCTRYGIPINTGANCVIVEAVRNECRTLGACVSLVDFQLNNRNYF